MGQTPNTGDTLINKNGFPTSNGFVSGTYITNGLENFNLLQQINCVQSFTYGFDVSRRPVLELGNNGTIYNPIIQHPIVNLEIETLQYGVENEIKMGLTANFTSFISGKNGVGFYASNPNILSGFYTRWTGGLSNILLYPRHYSDKKNFYILLQKDGNEIISATQTEQLNSNILSFGSCYLGSYIASARVGDLPRTKFSFVCDNVQMSTGAYGLNPALDPKNGNRCQTGTYVLPTFVSKQKPQVISPNNIKFSLSNNAGNLNLSGVGFDWGNLKVQEYQIELPLNREPLDSLTYKLPIFKNITYPVYATINISAIAGDQFKSALNDLFIKDNSYSLNIGLANTCVYNGIDAYLNKLVEYSFSNALLRSVQISSSVGQNLIIQLSFSQEVNPALNIVGNNNLMSISGFAFGRNNISYSTTNNLLLSGIDFLHISGNNTYIRGDI
ncbi:MAG: hypothetical protein EKK57_10170 [Proteobacteria bacterium]|nr:MAG: hypothetical protein EKK57_10170 [Pseudomonadota bacterium]